MSRQNKPYDLTLGTSQKNRLPAPLDPASVAWPKIDGRTKEDLIAFARDFSKLVQYYGLNNKPDGTWEAFFNEQQTAENPHYALFLAFLDMYAQAQEKVNTITQSHLELYFRDILHFLELPPTPDTVHVLFELAKNADPFKLEGGKAEDAGKTELDAGYDEQGNRRIYLLDHEIVVNNAKIESVKNIFVNEFGRFFVNHNAQTPVKKDIKGDPEFKGWPLFGEEIEGTSILTNPHLEYELGFAIASPLLELAEGDRTVILSINDIKYCSRLSIDDNSVCIYFSGKDDWIGPFEIESDLFCKEGAKIQTFISSAFPSITGYSPKLKGPRLNTSLPVMKVLCNPRASRFAYNELLKIAIKSMKLTVKVGMEGSAIGIRALDVKNDDGPINPKNPFTPFGASPCIGSRFFVGSPEAFRKPLNEVRVKWEWIGVPVLEEHYKHYAPPGEDKTIEPDDFTSSMALVRIKGTKEDILSIPQEVTLFKNNESGISGITDNAGRATSGYVKFVLNGPGENKYPFTAFGHNEFPNLFSARAVYNAKQPITSNVPLPERPYTPKLARVELAYSASALLNEDHNGGHQFFSIEPFGTRQKSFWDPQGLRLVPCNWLGIIHLNLKTGDPEITKPSACAFIGLRDIQPPQQVSILLQFVEGSEDTEVVVNKEDVSWNYLTEDQWVPFSNMDIGLDTTHFLRASGIMVFTIPVSATMGQWRMPGNTFWVMCSITKPATGIPHILGIHTQAASATFASPKEFPEHLLNPLPADSIKKLVTTLPVIKKVLQPYPSVNARSQEQNTAYYRRVSERLRHRNRGSDQWDYERLVLEKFPRVHTVKCLNHTNALTQREPGATSLVMVPDFRRFPVTDPLRPKLSGALLAEIHDYIQPRISTFISLAVQNPLYEEISVHATIRYHSGFDPGYYTGVLNDDLIKFLCPWAFNEGIDLVFGGKIHKADILHFIEQREYVDFVTEFWIEQITHGFGEIGIGYMVIREGIDPDFDKPDTFIVGNEVQEAEGSTVRSILTSEKRHELKVWNDNGNINA
jgi:hypothetical protein